MRVFSRKTRIRFHKGAKKKPVQHENKANVSDRETSDPHK